MYGEWWGGSSTDSVLRNDTAAGVGVPAASADNISVSNPFDDVRPGIPHLTYCTLLFVVLP